MFCRKRTAPQLKRVRVLSVRTETTEGGVVVRDRAHVSGKLVKRPAVATGGEPPFAAGANGSPKSGTSGHSLVLARLVALKSRGAISPGFFGFISILRREPVFISSGSVYS